MDNATHAMTAGSAIRGKLTAEELDRATAAAVRATGLTGGAANFYVKCFRLGYESTYKSDAEHSERSAVACEALAISDRREAVGLMNIEGPEMIDEMRHNMAGTLRGREIAEVVIQVGGAPIGENQESFRRAVVSRRPIEALILAINGVCDSFDPQGRSSGQGGPETETSAADAEAQPPTAEPGASVSAVIEANEPKPTTAEPAGNEVHPPEPAGAGQI